jgi:hypothetical protein
VEDLLRLGDDQLVQLLSIAGVKHKSIITFTHYATGLRGNAQYRAATASAASQAAQARRAPLGSGAAACSTPASELPPPPLPHASGPYAAGSSGTSVGGGAPRSPPPPRPPPPAGLEGGRLHRQGGAMESLSGLGGGSSFAPGAAFYALEKEFSAAKATTSDEDGSLGSPRTPFLRAVVQPSPLGGSSRGSPGSVGSVGQGGLQQPPFVGSALPGAGELPFDAFADVTKSLNVLMLHAKKSCVCRFRSCFSAPPFADVQVLAVYGPCLVSPFLSNSLALSHVLTLSL